MDYATFCGPYMPPFDCHCSATVCRRVIRGTDLLLPEIGERYGDRFSAFVRGVRDSRSAASRPPFEISAASRPPFEISAASRPPFEITINAFGARLIARRAWAAGDEVSPILWASRVAEPSRWMLQCGPREHAEPEPFELHFVNHSCSPNVYFDVGANMLRALRAIEPGDELRCFYPATEWAMAESFECRCGAAECLGFITGASRVQPAILHRYELSAVVREQLRLSVDEDAPVETASAGSQ